MYSCTVLCDEMNASIQTLVIRIKPNIKRKRHKKEVAETLQNAKMKPLFRFGRYQDEWISNIGIYSFT